MAGGDAPAGLLSKDMPRGGAWRTITASKRDDMAIELQNKALLRHQGYIDGRFVDADSGARFGVDDPATGERLAEVADMGTAETKRAIEAAHRALPAWRGKTAKERAAVLRRWNDLILANTEDLARLMTAEQGKPLAESRG